MMFLKVPVYLKNTYQHHQRDREMHQKAEKMVLEKKQQDFPQKANNEVVMRS